MFIGFIGFIEFMENKHVTMAEIKYGHVTKVRYLEKKFALKK